LKRWWMKWGRRSGLNRVGEARREVSS